LPRDFDAFLPLGSTTRPKQMTLRYEFCLKRSVEIASSE